MPLYYFHTQDGRCIRDDEGIELPNDDAARNEASVVLGELVKEDPEMVWRDHNFSVTVTDATGLILYVLDLTASCSPVARRA